MRFLLAVLLAISSCGCFRSPEKPKSKAIRVPLRQPEPPQLGIPQVHPSDFDDPPIK